MHHFGKRGCEMSEIKTHSTDDSVEELIAAIEDEGRRQDCFALLELMGRATGAEPKVWSSGLVGFGVYHYKSERSRQEGDWFPVGFASRKAAITVYLGLGLDNVADLLPTLGKHTTGKGCIYIKRLSDVDTGVLEQMVSRSYASMMSAYS